jgi:hypothetical protein
MFDMILVYLSQVGFLCKIIPRQIKAENAVMIIRNTVEELIMKCKEIVEAENEQIEGEEYVNEGDPSILRFLLASRDEVMNIFFFFCFFYFDFHNFYLYEAECSS